MRFRHSLGFLAPALAGFRRAAAAYGFIPSGCLRVLIYHDIAPEEMGAFEEQIRFLASQYRFVEADHFDAMMSGHAPILGGNLLLTFDDGFKSHRIVAERVLGPLGIHAIFFVPSDFISCCVRNEQEAFIARCIFDGGKSGFAIPASLAPMDWDDLKFLVSQGHVIGSHTRSHRRLSAVTDEAELAAEVVGSGDAIEERLGVPVKHFAYPFGGTASFHSRAVAAAGRRYRYAFSGVRGGNSKETARLGVRRDEVSPSYPLPYVQLIVEGGLAPYYTRETWRLNSIVAKGGG